MTIHNVEIADIFNKLADLLEIEGANPFRVRAYRNAALLINSLGKNIADLINANSDLTDLPGISNDLAEKIETIVKTGELPLLKEVEARTPTVLSELLKIEGLGPKRVQTLYKKLKIHQLSDLKTAIEKGKLKKLSGFGQKTEDKIRTGLLHITETTQRIKLANATAIAENLLAFLKQIKHIKQVECAGSYRRRKETLGDLDILVNSNQGKKIIDQFVKFDEITEVLSQGTTRSTVKLHSGIQVDLRVIENASYGAGLLYFTGSKAHNIALRKMAIQKGYKINEYGMFKDDKQIAGKTEHEMYKKIGLDYIEPELREDQGEIEAAKQHKLPKLITLQDMRGDLHCHTRATDGNANISAIARKAEDLQYKYIAVTDHTQHLTVAHGLKPKELLKQIKEIDQLNRKLKNLVILKSAEVDILENGKLDLPDEILAELDFTVCSIHSKFNLSEIKQTERIIRAMDNIHFNILAHPTGRLINERLPYAVNIIKIMQAAKERGCVLELNSQPARLDLNDIRCKTAKEIGVKIAISSDAHSIEQLNYLAFGIDQARRGWLEACDVINTLSLTKLKKVFNR